MNRPLRQTDSFYATIPEGPTAEDLLGAYEAFLRGRNGDLDPETGYQRREALMDDLAAMPGTFAGDVDPDFFNEMYQRFDPRRVDSQGLIALLTFVKVNAVEAYGVEVTTRVRGKKYAEDDPTWRMEKILAHEETYHTKMLCGITQHVEGLHVDKAWTPSLSLKILIAGIAHLPRDLFHPLLLGSEISGIYLFNWLLTRCGDLMPDQPEIRESMERRLIEVLIDEVGHVAYNRIAVGPRGLSAARWIAPQVVSGVAGSLPEYRAAGLDREVMKGIYDFDLSDLPQEVRDRSFFV